MYWWEIFERSFEPSFAARAGSGEWSLKNAIVIVQIYDWSIGRDTYVGYYYVQNMPGLGAIFDSVTA